MPRSIRVPWSPQAFVGYRDFGAEAGDGQHVVHDFVDKDSFRQDLTWSACRYATVQ